MNKRGSALGTCAQWSQSYCCMLATVGEAHVIAADAALTRKAVDRQRIRHIAFYPLTLDTVPCGFISHNVFYLKILVNYAHFGQGTL